MTDIDINSAASVSQFLGKMRDGGNLVVVLLNADRRSVRGHSLIMAHADCVIDARDGSVTIVKSREGIEL